MAHTASHDDAYRQPEFHLHLVHHFHHHNHHYVHGANSGRASGRQSLDPIFGVATGVAVGGVTALCLAVSILGVDVERIICICLLSLGYILLPVMAVLLALRALSASVHSSSSSLPQLGPLLTRMVYLASADVLAAIDAATTVVTTNASAGGKTGARCAAGPASTVQCAVCLDGVAPGATARVLPCSHVFHKGCADAWLLSAKKNSCPLCLAVVCADRDDNMELVPASILPGLCGAAACPSRL
jgi:Ring finger domain